MKSIIEEIYYGKCSTAEKIGLSEAYWKANSKVVDIRSKLLKILNKEQIKLLDALTWAFSKQESEACASYYSEGFKTGFTIAVECLSDE